MLADASVQGHRDFELVRIHSISRADTGDMFETFLNMVARWAGPLPDNLPPELLAADAGGMASLR
eukprot:9320940-Alexandrium_andersonii.AAC.1